MDLAPIAEVGKAAGPGSRTPLTRDRVLRAALALADSGGIEALTMRRLAVALRVEAMSLYNHVASKEDMLDGMVDIVFGEIGLPKAEVGWRTARRQRAISVAKPLDTPEQAAAAAEHLMRRLPADRYPHLAELTVEHVLQPGYDYADEFEFGLELVLNGLERARNGDSGA